ncbi:thiol reductant ABC exporter subunit CydD [Microbacterium sp. T2.11-28]|uniref:thiol reductant ABC exporter subunit CydD n=1 Tax=Microbacterium sp. T2.11-28 TaxID=3041169 RepID=UPI002477552F|nr:thiol reductant ABC exporter subunit CydD [Microbacterium sp. T2.11-28]CAI9394573.1 ATP-binding/permease protein CydD [Microbacterium sp. T2.11-28]
MAPTDDAPARTRTRPVDPRLLRYASASRGFFVVIAVLGLAQTLVVVGFAWLLTRAITQAIDGVPLAGPLGETLGWLAAIIAVRAVLLWARDTVSARAAARVQGQLRAHLVAAVGALGPGWLAAQNSARLAVTAGRGLEALDAYFSRYLPQLVQTAIATPIILAVMWWQDWISGLTVLLTLPLIPLFMVLIGLATRAVQQRQWQTLGRLAARFADTVRGLSTLKVFGRQHRAVASIGTVTDTYRRETMRVLRVSFLSGFALELLASIAVAIVAVSIGFRLMDGSMLLVVGLFVLLLAPEAYLPLRQVGVQFHAAAEGVAATDDVFAVLDAARAADAARAGAGEGAPAQLDGDAASHRAPSAQHLSAQHLSAQDLSAQDLSAQDLSAQDLSGRGLTVRDLSVRGLPAVSFTALPGTVTLIEGPSGAGKSSVLAALRGAAPYSGQIAVGGTDAARLHPSAWLAWAGQQPGLIAGTVADNVTLGDPAGERAPELIARALELAGAGGIPADLVLGVQGAGLSGGQAQRVAVARAFHRHLRGLAPVIALDEPSAALDADTEAALWHAVRRLADAGAAVLLVSHRTSARAIADQIVTLAPAAAEVTA